MTAMAGITIAVTGVDLVSDARFLNGHRARWWKGTDGG
jgi:hypothetical protein